jgi:hypothetical protein
MMTLKRAIQLSWHTQHIRGDETEAEYLIAKDILIKLEEGKMSCDEDKKQRVELDKWNE